MPTIMGIEAERGKGYRFNIRYNLNLNTHYNGRLSFSREYESKFCKKNGKQKTYRIKEVIGAEFLDGKINFLDIEKMILDELEHTTNLKNPDLETIFEVDREIRKRLG